MQKRAGPMLKLNSVVARGEDGAPITVRQVIVDWLGKGYPQTVAVGRAGISSTTMADWLRRGAAVVEKLSLNPHAKLTPDERDLLVFVRQVDEAVASGHSDYFGKLRDLAHGGLTRSKLRIKTQRDPTTGQTVEVERVQQVEQMLPSQTAITWILERQYNWRTDRADDDLLDDEEAARQLGDAMERWLTLHDADAPPVHHTNGASDGHGETAPH